MRSTFFPVCLLAVLVSACTQMSGTGNPEAEPTVTTFTKDEDGESVVIHSNIGGSSDIRNWRVIDSSTLLIETYSHGELVATFFSPCHGLRYAEALGFRTMGPFDLDRTTRVLLPDGTWCQIRELKPYVKLEEGNDNEE